MNPLIKIKNLKKYYMQDRKTVKAIDSISLEINPGETLSLVGESAHCYSVSPNGHWLSCWKRETDEPAD